MTSFKTENKNLLEGNETSPDVSTIRDDKSNIGEYSQEGVDKKKNIVDNHIQEDNDELLTAQENMATLMAQDGLIGYRIINATDETKGNKYRNQRSLLKDPPILEFFKIDKDTGEEQTVYYDLGNNIVSLLAEEFTTLDKAYKGILYTNSDEEIKEKFGNLKGYVQTHKIKSTFISFVILVVLFLFISSLL